MINMMKKAIKGMAKTLGVATETLEALAHPLAIVPQHNQRVAVKFKPGTELWVPNGDGEIIAVKPDDPNEIAGYKRQIAQALLDPILVQEGDSAKIDYSAVEANGLTNAEILKAARFTKALIALVKLLTGIKDIAIMTFSEAFIVSVGIFIFNSKGELLLIQKVQHGIGRGNTKKVWGRPSGFINHAARFADFRDPAITKCKDFIGWAPKKEQLRSSGPDVIMNKTNYSLTARNRCQGIIVGYVYQTTDKEEAEINAIAQAEGKINRWDTVQDIAEEAKAGWDAEHPISLEGEMPVLIEQAKKGFPEWNVKVAKAA